MVGFEECKGGGGEGGVVVRRGEDGRDGGDGGGEVGEGGEGIVRKFVKYDDDEDEEEEVDFWCECRDRGTNQLDQDGEDGICKWAVELRVCYGFLEAREFLTYTNHTPAGSVLAIFMAAAIRRRSTERRTNEKHCSPFRTHA